MARAPAGLHAAATHRGNTPKEGGPRPATKPPLQLLNLRMSGSAWDFIRDMRHMMLSGGSHASATHPLISPV